MKIKPIHAFQIGHIYPVESSVYGQFPLAIKHGFIIFRVTGDSGRVAYGFLTLLHPENQNTIRPHEKVIPEKVLSKEEEALTELTFTKPVCLLYEPDKTLTNQLMNGFEKGKIITHLRQDGALYEYAIHDDRVWAEELTSLVKHHKNLVIADGHHRTAAYFSIRNKENRDPGLYSAVLSLNQIVVRSYHRIIRIQADRRTAFDQLLKKYFSIEDRDGRNINERRNASAGLHQYVRLFDHKYWKTLKPKSGNIRRGSADLLALFHDKVLNPFCNEGGILTLDIIRFVSGSELEMDEPQLAPDEYLFLFPAVSREFLWSSSNQGEILPAKSTWIEPRIPSGVIEVPNIPQY